MKYNWSIIGHEKQLKMIESDILNGSIFHAYLLAGPNSVGKNTVAKKMAGILQCSNDFCHACPTCLQVEKGVHLDTIEMIDDKESIGIDDIRKIIERCNMTCQANYKIFLIQTVERMTVAAANSFLKVLEEPPQRTIFILTTNNIRAVLPTVVSRVRVVNFAAVSAGYLEKKLRELYPENDEETIKKVSLFSLGKTGKAVNLMENPSELANYIKVYNDVMFFLEHRNITDRFSYVNEFAEDEGKLETFVSILYNVLRSKILDGQDAEEHIDTVLKIDEAMTLIKKNVNLKLVLENLMLSLK
ncbi:AAA family ATPase [Candidatus Gracilibacteria bacterium]|jgi:DNA polymerase-3 subunit delta'|nr:AAA family ATPase [Candidatus Gracilibacteria bacterium]